MKRRALLLLTGVAALAGCATEAMEDDGGEAIETVAMLGPVDGHDMPPSDLDRVQVGAEAPDFTLASLAGPNVTLSDYRGEKNVVLVFYRGHW
jgi:hypothetical protein